MLRFFKCHKCGNIVELVKDGGGELNCCGEAMMELLANTVDASNEKHIPFVQTVDGKIVAKTGSTTHPMEEKHYIEWILFDDGTSIKKFALKPGEEPVAMIDQVEKCTVYSYCNLHGLWKSNFS